MRNKILQAYFSELQKVDFELQNPKDTQSFLSEVSTFSECCPAIKDFALDISFKDVNKEYQWDFLNFILHKVLVQFDCLQALEIGGNSNLVFPETLNMAASITTKLLLTETLQTLKITCFCNVNKIPFEKLKNLSTLVIPCIPTTDQGLLALKNCPLKRLTVLRQSEVGMKWVFGDRDIRTLFSLDESTFNPMTRLEAMSVSLKLSLVELQRVFSCCHNLQELDLYLIYVLDKTNLKTIFSHLPKTVKKIRFQVPSGDNDVLEQFLTGCDNLPNLSALDCPFFQKCHDVNQVVKWAAIHSSLKTSLACLHIEATKLSHQILHVVEVFFGLKELKLTLEENRAEPTIIEEYRVNSNDATVNRVTPGNEDLPEITIVFASTREAEVVAWLKSVCANRMLKALRLETKFSSSSEQNSWTKEKSPCFFHQLQIHFQHLKRLHLAAPLHWSCGLELAPVAAAAPCLEVVVVHAQIKMESIHEVRQVRSFKKMKIGHFFAFCLSPSKKSKEEAVVQTLNDDVIASASSDLPNLDELKMALEFESPSGRHLRKRITIEKMPLGDLAVSWDE